VDSLLDLFKTNTGELGLNEFFISIVFSLVVGIVCMLLYRAYFLNSFDRNESLTKSFVLIAPAITSIFWAIQYSLPLSLGLLGALSFVRFRTPIKKPEDIGFILIVIALSLLSSVFRFYAALILLGVIAAVVLVKSFIIDKNLVTLTGGDFITAFVSVDSIKIEEMDARIKSALARRFTQLKDSVISLDDIVTRDNGYNLRYTFQLRKGQEALAGVVSAIRELESIERVEVYCGRAS